MTPLQAAQSWIERGFYPIPVPFRVKKPSIESWQHLRLSVADVSKYFNGQPQNIGILLGEPYGNADVDLDCVEALACASEFLPETAMVFGRASRPASHFIFRMDPPTRSKRFLDPINKECLLELRCQKSDGSIGLQTIVPPSEHESGEVVRFEPSCDGAPANVDADVLLAAVLKIAAASLLARHWPGVKGGRNQTFIALAGALARAGWSTDSALTFHRALYRVLWGAGADVEASKAEVIATFEKHGAGFQTTGKRTLSDLLDKRAVHSAFTWLGIVQTPAPREEDAPPARRQMPAKIIAAPKCSDLEVLMDDDSVKVPKLLIEGLLPKTGLVLLGGRPKDGKSWFACQLALSLVTGRALGGWLKVLETARVQLWALEDQGGLTKDKMGKLLRGSRPDGLRDIKIFEELPAPLLRGGDQAIRAALREHPAEVIILDSLFKLSGASQANGDIGQRDYDTIDRVRQIAIDHSAVAIVVMHTKKNAQGGNPIENLLGTTGTPAAADAIAELKRFRNGTGKLTVVGRSVPGDDYALQWQGGPDDWGWTIADQGDQADGDTAGEVLAYLEAQGASKPATIAQALRKSFGAVWQALLRLHDKGKVTRSADKRWESRR